MHGYARPGCVANRNSRWVWYGETNGSEALVAVPWHRHFRDEVIVLCLRWYLRFRLSYRDLVSIAADMGFGGSVNNSAAGDPLHGRVREPVGAVRTGGGSILAAGHVAPRRVYARRPVA